MDILETKNIRKINIEFNTIKEKVAIFLFEVDSVIDFSKIYGINWLSIEKIRYSYNKNIFLINNLLKNFKFEIIQSLFELGQQIKDIKSLITKLYNIFIDDIKIYDIWLENNNILHQNLLFRGKIYKKTTCIIQIFDNIERLLI